MKRLLALLCLAVGASAASAQTVYTWNGSSNGNWSSATNWSPGLPVSNLTDTDVWLSGTTNLVTTVDLLQGSGGGFFDLRFLFFDPTAGTFNITPSNTNITTLRIGAGGITNDSTFNQTISNPLAIGAAQTWTTSTTGRLFVDAPVAATGQTITYAPIGNINVTGNITGGTHIKTGTGSVVFAGNNTLASTTISQGTLIVNKVGTGSPIGTNPVSLAGGTLSFQVFGNPVPVSGFNHDVITAISEAGAAPYGTTRAVDGNNGSGAFVYFQQGVNPNPAFGAPASGRFQAVNNPAVTYQLGDYTGNNVLSFGANTAGSADTTLTLATPGSFRSINIMNVTGSGSAAYSFTLNFGDGTSTTVTGNSSPDWFGGPAAVTLFQVNGRFNRNNGTFDAVGSGNPRIYGRDYTLTAADQSKTLNSITFATTNTGTYTFNVFGLAGTAGSDTQVFTNPINVVADSTLDQQNVSNVTVGPLSIGTNVLTVTGSLGATMTTGAATLNGDPTFAPQGNATLVLGAIAGGATPRTISKAGTGTLTLGTAATSLAVGSSFNPTDGTTQLAASGALGTTTNVVMSGGAIVNVTANQTFGALSGTGGAVILNTSTVTIGGGTSATYQGTLNGGSVIVTGTGTNQTLISTSTATAFTVQNNARLATATNVALGSGVTLTGTSTLSLGVGSANAVNVTGFGGGGTGWNLQGTVAPTVTADVLSLTPNSGGVAATAWYATSVPNGPFNVSFRYSQLQGTNAADGMTFTIQSQSDTAVGTPGGGLGYGGITPSVAFALNIFAANTLGYKVGANGVLPAGAYNAIAPVNLNNAGAGNEITVALAYDGSNLTGTLTQGANVFTLPTTTVDIASIVGPNGFFGFTGGTGGITAQQSIDNFSYATPDGSIYAAGVTLAPAAVSTVAVNFNAAHPTASVASLTVGAGAALIVSPEAGTTADAAYGLAVRGITALAGASTITVNNNGMGSGTLTLAGDVNGAGSITKTGPGTLVLSGTGTYTGTTTVAAGTLTLTGSGSFAISPVVNVVAGATLATGGVTGGANFDGFRFSLASGQTLTGGGTVNGSLGVASGATVSPGTGPGRLTVTGDTIFGLGSTFFVELNGTVAGTQHDQLVVGGIMSLDSPTLTGTLSYTPAAGNMIFIINNQGVGAVNGTFLNLPASSTFGIGAFTAQISYSGDVVSGTINGGNDVVLYNFQPVPEPALLLAIGGLLAMWPGRRMGRVIH